HAVVNEDHAEGDPQREQGQRISGDGIAQHNASTKRGEKGCAHGSPCALIVLRKQMPGPAYGVIAEENGESVEPGGTDRNRSAGQQQRKECGMPFGRLFAGRWRPGKLRGESSARRGRVQRKKKAPMGRLADSPTGKVLPLPVGPVYPVRGIFRRNRSGSMSE